MDAQDVTHHAGRPSQEDIAGEEGLLVPGGGAVIRTLQELSQKPVAQRLFEAAAFFFDNRLLYY